MLRKWRIGNPAFSATFNQDVMTGFYRWLYQADFVEICPNKTSQNIERRRRRFTLMESDKLATLQQIIEKFLQENHCLC